MSEFDKSRESSSRRRKRDGRTTRNTEGEESLVLRGYHVMQTIGRGTTGIVYRAVQLSMQREVALKVLAPELARTPGFAERFIREARAAGAVHHPNVVTCYDVGEIDGVVYQALELMSGGDLSQLLTASGGILPYKDVVAILIECARGLEGIHRAGLVHCDIRPSNIFITQEDIIKLADLGLARSLASGEWQPIQGGLNSGLATLAPEQLTGKMVPDIRVDTYALGATLFIAAAGAQPFEGGDTDTLMHHIITGPVPDPRDYNSELPEELSWVVAKAMAKDPHERYATPVQLREDLERLQFDFAPIHAKGMPRPSPVANPGAARRRSASVGRSGTAQEATKAAANIAKPTRSMPSWLVLAVLPSLAIIAVLACWQLFHASTGASPSKVTDGATATVAQDSTSGGTKTPSPPALLPPNPSDASAHPGSGPATTAAQVPVWSGSTPHWASRSGVDCYGRWIEISIGTAVQRFRHCAAGTFQMGSTADDPGRRDDEVSYRVTLTHPFWIADSEVNQRLYEVVMAANPSAFKGPDLPVESVSWHDAQSFIRHLNTLLPSAGLRLPSEAEWEYACRGGAGTDVGSASSAQAWTATSSDGHTHPVKQLAANPWGLYDMLGNVLEWCQDSYGPYPNGSATDPVGWQGINHVARGGAWSQPESTVRAAARTSYAAGTHFFFLGLRLVATDVEDGPR